MDQGKERLDFQEEHHAYWWDGMYYVPSVTQILDANEHVSKFCKSASHADKGKEIHDMISLFIDSKISKKRMMEESKNRLDVLSMLYREELNQFEEFCSNFTITFLSSEKTSYGYLHEGLGDIPDWAGTTDIIAMVNGEPAIIDVKTGASIPPHARLQTAAYVLSEFPLDYDSVQRFALRINTKTKKYKTVPYTNLEDYEEWRNECRRYHRNNPR